MNRSEVLDIIDSATLQAIKTLTTKRALMKAKYFVLENVPTQMSIQKILSFIRLQGNLNFIFFIQKRLLDRQSDSCSWIFGCRNSLEFNNFLWQYKELSIDGCTLLVKSARKDLEARRALLTDTTKIPFLKLIKMKASSAYNKFFPSERMMEIIIEGETNNVLKLIDGIFLNYKHSTKILNDEIYISSFKQHEVSLLQNSLIAMGNSDVMIKSGSLFLFEKSVWARQMSLGRDDDDVVIHTIDSRLIDKDIITNSLDINNIRNSLI